MVLLDAGHGGHDKEKYHCIANGKKFRHGKDGYHYDSGIFYEGVWNRYQVELIKNHLFLLNIPYVEISDSLLDLSLSSRVTKVNYYHRLFPKSFLISVHANASPSHNARGYEVYTSPGVTKSDQLATIHYNMTKEILGDKIRYRSDTWSDGDVDKEARFTMLTRTTCPAILIEHLFFDNKDDVELLMNEDINQKFAQATAYTCKRFKEFFT